ncbi:MAG: ABC transporter ATP-binding protein [Candidatus Thorarchaeota archaeon]
MSAKAIEVKKLTRRYGYRVALREVTLDFSEKGVQGLFGSNGAGKTTLFRVLSTLLRPHGGSVTILGIDLEENPEEVKKKIGILGDKPLLYQELTGMENLQFYSKLYSLPREFFEDNLNALVERFEVKTWLEEPVKNLSTGMRKRLDIVRSLLHNPDLLLLDEPFSGLDKDSAAVFREYLNEHRRQRTTIVTTHNLALGAELCDEYVTLRKGRVISQGPIEQFDQML